MNHPRWMMAALVSLLAFAGVQGAFDDTHPDESPDDQALSIDSADVTVESERHFTVDDTDSVNITLQLLAGIATTDDNYTVDAYLSTDNGTTETQVFSGQDNTTESTTVVQFNATHDGLLRMVLNVPANRSVGDVEQKIFIVHEDGTKLRHTLTVYNYDPDVDSDADHLPDDYEDDTFGNLTASNGESDFDGDGFSDFEEFEAGSDPKDENSTPQNVIVSGSVGSIDDRDAGNIALAIFLTGLALLIGGLIAGDRTKKKYDLDEPFVMTIIGIIGGTVIVTMIFLALFDVINLANTNWAWWTRANLSWAEWSLFSVLSAAAFIGAAIAFTRIRQNQEKKALWVTLGIFAVLIVVAVTLFVFYDVPWLEVKA